MPIRLLLILSLVSQLAYSFQCCALLVLHPSLVCAAPGKRAVAIDNGGTMRAGPCGTTPPSCGDGAMSCRPGGAPCGGSDSTPNDEEGPSSCDDGDCEVAIPVIPLKDKANAIVVLLPAMIIAYLHRADFGLRTPRATSPSTAPRVLMTSHARRALLSVWLN